MSPTWATEGIHLKIALLEKGYRQQDAAKLMNMPLSTFNMKLRGKRAFTPGERRKLAFLLGKNESELFPETFNKRVKNTQETLPP